MCSEVNLHRSPNLTSFLTRFDVNTYVPWTRPCQRLLLPACVLSLRSGLTVRYLLVSNLFVTIHQMVTCHTLSGLTSHDIINFSFKVY